MKRYLLLVGLIVLNCLGLNAQYKMETINRGLVAVRTSVDAVYIGWRYFGTDEETTAFNIYRDGAKLNNIPIEGSTNYIDSVNTDGMYFITAVNNGVEADTSEYIHVWQQDFLEIDLQQPNMGTVPTGASYIYSPNDCSIGDLDGDGQYEIVVKWDPSLAKDNSQGGYTGNAILDAYEFDGTHMWRIDLGKNIRAGAHYTQFIVYDLDGDGIAEVACKTADGTIDGQGNVIGDVNADYRAADGYILSGPEFLTIFNGTSGAAMATTNYLPPRGNVGSWGDTYGNRVDRFLAGVGYFDGEHPSLLMCRGYYTRSVLVAWDWRNGALTERWTFDSDIAGTQYAGRGNHQLSIADVDADGKDEVIYGALCVDDDGSARHVATWFHGDALHVSDLIPSRPGLEIFMPVEWASANPADQRPGVTMRDANTGALIWGKYKDGDIGRGLCADIDSTYPGVECWASGGLGMYDAEGNHIGSNPSSINFAAWWDGDLLRELLDGTAISKPGLPGFYYTFSNALSNNGTKSNPGLTADIFGDWREEVVMRTTDNTHLRIYTTTDYTAHRLYTLMHNPQYRVAVAWQNVGYNQPPHPDYYIGPGMSIPPQPNISLIPNIGLDEVSKVSLGINVFPNPVNNQKINVAIASPDKLQNLNVSVSDLNGRLVYDETCVPSNNLEINLPVSPGIYLLNISNQQGIYKKKIVVR